MSRDEAYLNHILEAISKIEEYTAVGRDEFLARSHWLDLEAVWEVARNHLRALRAAVEEILRES